jgi:hypothetical protein
MTGKWYIVLDCARCVEPVPVGEVPPVEEEPEVKFSARCALLCLWSHRHLLT